MPLVLWCAKLLVAVVWLIGARVPSALGTDVAAPEHPVSCLSWHCRQGESRGRRGAQPNFDRHVLLDGSGRAVPAARATACSMYLPVWCFVHGVASKGACTARGDEAVSFAGLVHCCHNMHPMQLQRAVPAAASEKGPCGIAIGHKAYNGQCCGDGKARLGSHDAAAS